MKSELTSLRRLSGSCTARWSEQRFTGRQRIAWKFNTLAEAAEAGCDKTSAALRDCNESIPARVLIEVHGMLGGRGEHFGTSGSIKARCLTGCVGRLRN